MPPTVPLPLPTTLAPTAPLDLVGRQVNFHVSLLVDFVVTGAQLIGRQVQVPGTLLQDLQNGTPLPVAVGRALQTLVEVELDAGRELVGYATEYLAFQTRFLADLIALPFAVVAAVSEAVGSFFTAVAPAPVVESSVPVQTVALSTEVARIEASAVEAVEDEPATDVEDVKVADEPKKPAPTISAPDADSDTVTTVRAQGEVRSGTTEAAEPTDTTDVDHPTSTARDEPPEDDESAGEQPSEPEAQPDNDGADDAAQKDSSGEEG